MADHAFAHLVNFVDLGGEFTEFEVLAIGAKFTGIDVVPARAVRACAPENEELGGQLVVGDGRGPARLWPPAALGDGRPFARRKLEEHHIVKAGARHFIVDGFLDPWCVQSDNHLVVAVTESVIVFTPVDEHVLTVLNHYGLMIAPWQWLDSHRIATD